jgi:hypothetical protein
MSPMMQVGACMITTATQVMGQNKLKAMMLDRIQQQMANSGGAPIPNMPTSVNIPSSAHIDPNHAESEEIL